MSAATPPEELAALVDRICCDKCPLGLSCATQSWCYLAGRELEGGR